MRAKHLNILMYRFAFKLFFIIIVKQNENVLTIQNMKTIILVGGTTLPTDIKTQKFRETGLAGKMLYGISEYRVALPRFVFHPYYQFWWPANVQQVMGEVVMTLATT